MNGLGRMRIGSLFSGAGMLDEGVCAVLGGGVAWHCENDPAASRVLAYRYPGVPNLGDITAVDWSQVEPVDVLTGGSPCQDVSAAGKRAGMHDGTRSNLWVAMREAIAVLRPRLVVWENVRGAYTACADSEMGCCPRCVGEDPAAGHAPLLRALGRVLGDLSDLGYLCRWTGLRAADVGAPHGRFRVFVVATDAAHVRHERAGVAWGRRDGSAHDRCCDNGHRDAPGLHSAVFCDGRHHCAPSHSDITGSQGRESAGSSGCDGWSRDTLWEAERRAAATRTSEVAWGKYEPAIRQWERLTRPVPHPTTTGARGGQQLSGVFDEWLMGLPGGWITDVPGISNNDALRLCGNGVVPQQAAAAVEMLLSVEACEAVA